MHIKKAMAIYGMGDALNQRAFLAAYCRQKKIHARQIAIYTDKYWWMFEGMGFVRGRFKSEFRNLTPYDNFGLYDLPKRYECEKLDECIAKNAGIEFSFDTCEPLFTKGDISKIELPNRFITFNTGYGEFSGKAGDKTTVCLKSWPKAYWEEFVKQIKIPCVQIGAGKSCEIIQGAALNLVDKLTIQQSAEVMRRAVFHVDMEGGLPILAQHIGKKSVVLFGPTAIEQQGRSFNLNISANVCTPCYEWGEHKGSLYAKKADLTCGHKCMQGIKPEYVIQEIKRKGWL